MVPQPAWAGILDAKAPGKLVRVGNGAEEITAATAPAVFQFPETVTGANSSSRYPDGPPWPVKGDAPIYRNPGSYLESGPVPRARGFEFTGTFAGALRSYQPGSMLIESAFFHESPIYFGGVEYGFYYEMTAGAAPRLIFYWSTNSNCGYQPSICRTGREGGDLVYENGSTVPPPLTRVHGCAVPLATFAEYRYRTWIFDDQGEWKFRIEVANVDGRDVIPPMSIDPNVSGGDWFPIREMGANGRSGYFSAGIIRSDPTNSMVIANPVSLNLKRFRVARQSSITVKGSGTDSAPPKRKTRSPGPGSIVRGSFAFTWRKPLSSGAGAM